ncbi:SDR family oxidoreductase [Ideonella dechloratans]|uniref:SDR family oxidoreductase n=1 Tax=Ideonella dechloratans TaxID=36863 RepID=A0A643F8K5_IDEDE|nr:SDR family oxidoreductase [Ideonella dechloratans]KAB0575083.1 SDR family oxidoreductase [Ideonella dechloratans]UFU08678.1 SDR family oxidoreductase [Ideonella dechloratans]
MSQAGGVVLVTGGSRGIGAAVVRQLAAQGTAVLFSYRREVAAAQALVAEVQAAGGLARAVPADVADEAQVLAMFATLDAWCAELGRPFIGLVNNAGVLETQRKLVDMDVGRWERVLRTNVIGSFLCAREAVRRMARSAGGAGGSIVNLSSRAARLGAAFEYVDYAASKAAVDAMTLGLSREVAAEGIRVNAVAPGLIRTDIHASGGEPGRVDRLSAAVPLGRGGEPEEVAQAVLWLLSEASSYTTGTVLEVSGGR